MNSTKELMKFKIKLYYILTGLAAYFILVYYIYAVQLERELVETQDRPEMTANDIAFIYPTKTDKQNLVLA